ncbi:hypothetical protein [Bacillus mycoides]|uniref:hypothetical protein n=1 Tax=Bacillus mycoides TaxID=1405 RepID=UPI001E3DFAB9|nr:hypothetical protein [Bacillus mycoides]
MIKRFTESGYLVDAFSEVNTDGDLIKPAELFSVGKHRGRNYTEGDLHRLVNSFNPAEQVPLQLDHSESVKDTVGLLEEVSVEGYKLMGVIRVVDDTTKERVGKKLAKKLSISFYTDEKGNPQKIREISLVAFPQVKNARMFSEHPQLDDRKQALYEKAREFQLQMRFRALQAQVEKNKLKLEQAKKELAEERELSRIAKEKQFAEEYQAYLDSFK